MKQATLFLVLFFSITLSAQEVISETQEHVPYQDTLFTLKTTRIVGTGYEGLNDTIVSYSMPTDTAGVVVQLHVSYLNQTNQAVAKLRNAVPFRFILSNYVASKSTLATLGYDLDSLNVQRYGSGLSGRYRVFNEDGSDFFANVAPHPTQTGLLRATGETGEGNFNILIYGRHFFRLAFAPGDVKYLKWDGGSNTRPIYQNPVRMTMPGAIATADGFRMVKLN